MDHTNLLLAEQVTWVPRNCLVPTICWHFWFYFSTLGAAVSSLHVAARPPHRSTVLHWQTFVILPRHPPLACTIIDAFDSAVSRLTP